ncbi:MULTISPECIES: hypothetical protein [unclassified Rhizobium]|uniref:hypothetical protein n=1 Tax=unclassified Rhizobium TaxID=2613769 RepID=UPI0007EBEFCA|nr:MULTISPECIES: hypothetical protein [unclassified Rhizobium]ANK86049.1 hypothetical protein AMK02_CH02475 [Rhizobium sp. N731]ANL16295.1 hypothetical protein AMJ97_CH02473 [Rhizobium sp. N1314]
MVRRTMVLTQRMRVCGNRGNLPFYLMKPLFRICHTEGTDPAKTICQRRILFLRAGNGWLHRQMFEIWDVSTAEEKRI